ncbi:leucine-rich repeat extensin-like protein 3 [Panicum virgatum]|uniref:leucine-rich repeat extensin-like protein 3 n=1 Tax=Panicum virgatum TaxID=38727 RepID=UPI0019D57556|nr:leucine-rich repeat extensin-like protein 3 [Panicum virgatum]
MAPPPTASTRSPSSAHPRPQPYSQRALWPLTGPPKPAHHHPQATGELPPRYRPPPAVCSSGTPLPNPPPPEIALGIGPPPHPEALQLVLAAPPSPERRRRGAPPPPAALLCGAAASGLLPANRGHPEVR